jgi:aryl-alcohol dehydrogenase-like predicted oxidoreductase
MEATTMDRVQELTGMEQVRLGRTDLHVSPIAFGTWQLGGDWGPTDEEAAIAAIRHAADEGVNLFDTAQGYGFGASERLLVKALAGRPRDQVVIATKGGLRPTTGGGVERDASPSWVRQGVEESLKSLDTDYIDLYQVHWPDPKVPFAATAGALRDLVAEGKIRHVGVSNFDAEQMEAFSGTLPVETLQPPYHLFRRDIEASVLPYTRAHDVGVLAYGPLAHGLLGGGLTAASRFAADDWRSKSAVFKGDLYQANLRVVAELEQFAQEMGTKVDRLAVAWVLANPAVDVAIVGTRNPRHVDDAIAATELRLDTDAMSRIDQIMAGAVPVGGPSPESV